MSHSLDPTRYSLLFPELVFSAHSAGERGVFLKFPTARAARAFRAKFYSYGRAIEARMKKVDASPILKRNKESMVQFSTDYSDLKKFKEVSVRLRGPNNEPERDIPENPPFVFLQFILVSLTEESEELRAQLREQGLALGFEPRPSDVTTFFTPMGQARKTKAQVQLERQQESERNSEMYGDEPGAFELELEKLDREKGFDINQPISEGMRKEEPPSERVYAPPVQEGIPQPTTHIVPPRPDVPLTKHKLTPEEAAEMEEYERLRRERDLAEAKSRPAYPLRKE